MPSKRVSTPRIWGTVSRAATKCISEVPGLAKHTSTPPSTSVRIRACAPFIATSLVKENAGVENPARVECLLDPAHQRHLVRVLQLEEMPLLFPPDAVL